MGALFLTLTPCVAQDLRLPQDPGLAYAMASADLLAQQYGAIHQINAFRNPPILNQKALIVIQEIWIDLVTGEYKQFLRTAPLPDNVANPLESLDVLMALPPSHGSWKTLQGSMAFHSENGKWNPAILHSEPPYRDIFQRMKSDWYLLGTRVPMAAAGEDQNAAAFANLQRMKALIAAGNYPVQIRENNGLIDELRVVANGVTSLRVMNEYLAESPIKLGPQEVEALRKHRQFVILAGPNGLKPPTNGRGFGVIVGADIQGAFIRSVHENSPASRAGVTAGDRIILMDGKKLSDLGVEAIDTLRSVPTITLVLRRENGESYTVTLNKDDWAEAEIIPPRPASKP